LRVEVTFSERRILARKAVGFCCIVYGNHSIMYKAAMLTFERKVVVGTGVLNQAFFLFFLGQSSPLQFIKHLGETIEGEYN